MTVTLTEAHLGKLTGEDLRAIALRILTDAVNALNTYIDEHDLASHLGPAPVHEAADWLRKAPTNPDDGYDTASRKRHSDAIHAFLTAAHTIGKATTGNGDKFPPYRNAYAVDRVLDSVDCGRSITYRPSAFQLHLVLDKCGDGFIPGHETTLGYALKAICDSDDPRLPALAETYMQSGLHVNLRPAIDEAEGQLARLDELTELNR